MTKPRKRRVKAWAILQYGDLRFGASGAPWIYRTKALAKQWIGHMPEGSIVRVTIEGVW